MRCASSQTELSSSGSAKVWQLMVRRSCSAGGKTLFFKWEIACLRTAEVCSTPEVLTAHALCSVSTGPNAVMENGLRALFVDAVATPKLF